MTAIDVVRTASAPEPLLVGASISSAMDQAHIARLEEMAAEHERLLDELASPEVAGDHQRSAELAQAGLRGRRAVRLYESGERRRARPPRRREMLQDAAEGGEDEDFLRDDAHGGRGDVAELEARLARAPRSARSRATTARSSSRSGRAPGATKPRSSPATSCACTSATRSGTAGRPTSSSCPKEASAA